MIDWAPHQALFELADVLCYSFDLELVAPRPADCFDEPAGEGTVFAGDVTGGAYLMVVARGQRHGIHVDVVGQLGVLGRDLCQTLGVVVALPYWRELLAEMKGGDLQHGLLAALRLEQAVLDDLPVLDEARQEIWKLLPPVGFEQAVEVLYTLNIASRPQLPEVSERWSG